MSTLPLKWIAGLRAQRFIKGLGRDLMERSTCVRQPPCGRSPMCQACIDGFVLFCHETRTKGPEARRRWGLFAEWKRESWRREAADV